MLKIYASKNSGESRRVSVVSAKTPFEILWTDHELSNLNALIEQSDQGSKRAVTSRYSILIEIMREKERKARLVREKKEL